MKEAVSACEMTTMSIQMGLKWSDVQMSLTRWVGQKKKTVGNLNYNIFFLSHVPMDDVSNFLFSLSVKWKPVSLTSRS